MKIAGRFHEVEAWNGVPGIDIDADVAAKLKALGVPVHESARVVPGSLIIDEDDAICTDNSDVLPFYRVAAPIGLLAKLDVDLAAWAYRAYEGAELDAVYRLYGSRVEFVKQMLTSKQEDDLLHRQQHILLATNNLETDDGSET